MHEKLSSKSAATSSWDSLKEPQTTKDLEHPEPQTEDLEHPEPRFPEDPRQYSEAELMEDPAKRYHVNPDDFPIFRTQGEKKVYGGPSLEQNLDATMSRYVTNTADTIATIAGESQEGGPKYDHIIYLDKSARPVSWLVNTFWGDFTEKERPPHSYLSIDRADWFKKVGIDTDNDGRMIGGDRSKITFENFRDKADALPPEIFAQLRALYIEGGIDTEDPSEIMKLPATLDGKRILIVDEVSRTGSTREIAKYLVSHAFKGAYVQTTTFWDPGVVIGKDESDIASSPVWYDPKSEFGRGIGPKNPEHYKRKYEAHPNPKNRAQRFGAILLATPLNLAEEPGQPSRELMREIKTMHQEYQEGHILMTHPKAYSESKWIDKLESQGIQFVPPGRNGHTPKNAYVSVCNRQK